MDDLKNNCFIKKILIMSTYSKSVLEDPFQKMFSEEWLWKLLERLIL